MNYGRKGVRKIQDELISRGIKFKKMGSVMLLKILLVGILAVLLASVCVVIGAFKGIISSAPDISSLDVVPEGYATTVYDSEGHEMTKLIAENSNRTYVSMEKIPQNLANAFVALEDERFYTHNGIDIKGIIRSGTTIISSGGEKSQGGSTITQQLLKNNVFEGWATEKDNMAKVRRKIQEQYLAVNLERELSKEQILELYMNTINLGQNTLGVQAASMRYFGKQVYQLNLSECAVIAAITQNPTKYNPISHPDSNQIRRDICLKYMCNQGYITEEERDAALADDVYSRIQTVNQSNVGNTVNSYFVDELTEQMVEDLQEICGYDSQQAYRMLYSGGLKIYTTMNPEIQSIADEVFSNEDNYPANAKYLLSYNLTIDKANGDVENHSPEMFQTYYKQFNPNFNSLYNSEEEANAAVEDYKLAVMEEGDEVRAENINITIQPQVSLTVEEQSTGYVVAMVGGRGPKLASRTLNRASNTTRQPGSTFKIVAAYAPAFDSLGLTLADVKVDEPYNYSNGRPVSNWYGGAYRDIQSLRQGIAQSLNIIAVKTITQVTPKLAYEYLLKFGFTTLVESRTTPDGRVVGDINQSLALGGLTDGITNMELNAAYATIANQGLYIKPTLYTKVLDNDGNVILDKTAQEGSQVIKETTAFLLTDAMVSVVTSGTGGGVNFGNMSIAGKTGTTSDYNDVWFAGFTPYYTATTWAGYDNNEKLPGDGSRNLAQKLWRGVMSRIHADLPNKSFPTPNGIVTATVCSKSGRLPIAGLCDGCLKSEYFAQGTVPTASCDVHYAGAICEYSGRPACEGCPFKVEGVTELHPSETVNTIQSEYNLAKSRMCPHNTEFYLQPGAQAIIAQQSLELEQRRAAALAALEAAAAAQAAAEGGGE
ncbi:MAG: transglycosylase domain-containing protein [Lachnospiraceae bacterium]|nr:transglycosylase domain-containing protein [Lachnospiraceae bacterium]